MFTDLGTKSRLYFGTNKRK